MLELEIPIINAWDAYKMLKKFPDILDDLQALFNDRPIKKEKVKWGLDYLDERD